MQRADLHLCRLARNTHGCAGKAIEEFSQFIEEAEVRHGSGQPHPHALPVHTQRSAAATVCLVRLQQSSAANGQQTFLSGNFAKLREAGPLRQP